MTLKIIKGGFKLSADDEQLLNEQKALTREINEKFIQVGATFLKPASKFPVDEDWFKKLRGDVDLQAWVDDEQLQPLNVGFNLQQGWCDIDIDAPDPEFTRCVVAAMEAAGIDTRFRFGRLSVGVPSHVFVQLPEDESRNFEDLRRFVPSEFRVKHNRYHVEVRSFPTNIEAKNLVKSAKQTVMPGSIYASKKGTAGYDLSVWYGKDLAPATNIESIAETTPKKASFSDIIRAVAFGTVLYVIKDHWLEGSRQVVAQKFTGWLARVVGDSQGINQHESLSNDVFCPLDSDAVAEKLIKFICDYQHDDETFMRVRAFYDAREKLARNPDAKVPGWHSIQEMVGPDLVQALRVVCMPGNDVSKLTQFVDRYVYDETDNKYIDRERHRQFGIFTHDGADLERRHKGDIIFVSGKPREAFKVFESSALRKRVGYRDMFPDLDPGQIFRVDLTGAIVPDEAEEQAATVFNTWRGWPVAPVDVVDEPLMRRLVEHLDRLIGYLTQDNPKQVEWVKKWIAWIFQHPGVKQQVALVVMGGQGVGKSFFGNVFMRALLTERLYGSASPKILDGKFTISPFKDKMFVFIDEASFHGNAGAVDEVKKLIRNTDINGMEKFEEARDYRIFARLMFASNRFDINISDRDVRDRALFYTKAYSHTYLNMAEMEFRSWTNTLKPWFDEFTELLKDKNVLQHYIRYFMDLDVTRHELESIEHSSSNDPEIAKGNMSWARRVAKAMIEEGYIAMDDLSWETPFLMPRFRERALDVAKSLGLNGVKPDNVMNEFESMGIFGRTTKKGIVSKKRWGDALAMFANSTGLDVQPYRDLDEKDHGDNSNDETTLEKRRGIKASAF